MNCPKCGAENRFDSRYCRYCGEPLPDPDPGYIPSVPPPNANSYGDYYSPQPQSAPQQVVPPPPLPAVPMYGQKRCPRCGSNQIMKGEIATWAIVATIIGFIFICFVSLLFLLIKEPNTCLNCGLQFK
ncbi:MAG: double zinc ribbon domain-containing protein [Blastocatellia bacterium]